MKYPSIQEYKTYIESADSNKDKNKDNSKLYETLWNMMIDNPRIRGHVNTRRAGVLSWGFKIIPNDKQYIDVAEKAYKRLSKRLSRIISKLIDVQIFGLCLLKLEWELSDLGWVPKTVVSIPVTKLEAMSDGTIIEKIDNKKVLHSANQDTTYIVGTDSDDITGGQMRSVGQSEILRDEMEKEWANYNKKLKGIIQAVEHGADDDDKKAAIESLKTAITHNFLLTSDLVDFKFHSITASSSDSFKALIEHLENSIAIALLGQANTSELPKNGGSRAALQVQAMISADLMFSDIQIVEQIINEQLLVADYKLNYKEGTPPYKFIIDTNEAEDTEKNVMVVREAISAGIPLIKSEVYQKIGFTVPQTTDEIFTLLT